MSVKTHFSIKDLENLSGVKAHTIRICKNATACSLPKEQTLTLDSTIFQALRNYWMLPLFITME